MSDNESESSSSSESSESSSERKRKRDKKEKKERKREKKEKKKKEKHKKKKEKEKKKKREREGGEMRSIITGKKIKHAAGSVAHAEGEARRQVRLRSNREAISTTCLPGSPHCTGDAAPSLWHPRWQALLAHMNEGEGMQWERPGSSRSAAPVPEAIQQVQLESLVGP
jgi:hypothetical protein